ncbi:MAG TPA: hypothetical protein PK609_01915 [Candidatus Paceibacterota bacterium]|nr:hypothetical protein [Candidatus Paceibacterota bacterium]
MDEITIGDKVYVSSKRAAKITGYAKDYVGQLCREGRVEARLVGRSWYVLESAIKEHRFGNVVEEEEKQPEKEPEAPVDRSDTWQKPQYVSEPATLVPELSPKTATQGLGNPPIADMQSAWREWFADTKPLETLSDGSEDFKDEYLPVVIPQIETAPEEAEIEEPVILNRIAAQKSAPLAVPEEIEPAIDVESPVELHKSYASRSTGEGVPVTTVPIVDLTPHKVEKGRATGKKAAANSSVGSGSLRAVLLVIAVLSVLISIVGTGNADRLLAGTSFDFGVQKTIVDFLGGKSTYESSL